MRCWRAWHGSRRANCFVDPAGEHQIFNRSQLCRVPAVFRSTGRWPGRVRLPPRFQLLDVGRDYMLGIRRDSLDVQFVELYSLRR